MDLYDIVGFTDEEQFFFLLRIYQSDSEQQYQSVSLWGIARELEYANSDAQRLADLLHNKGLLNFVSLSGNVCLTSLGSFEVMLALSQPNRATRFFPAISTFKNSKLPLVSMTHGSVSGFVDQLREFCNDLSIHDGVSDHLDKLICQLETAVQRGDVGSAAVVNELKAIDQLLSPRLTP